MLKRTITLIAISLGSAACGSSDFTGASPKRTTTPPQPVAPPQVQPPTETPRPINLTCNTQGETPIVEAPSESVQVQGEVCPKSFGKLAVVFVVDFSGSMAQADPGSGIFGAGGCGRSRAAEQIVTRLKRDMRNEDDIQVGMVAFGTDARIDAQLTSIRSLTINSSRYCGSNLGATNYRRGLEEARNAFGAFQGNKVVYFISDGFPTAGGASSSQTDTATHQAAGQSAADALRQAHPGLVMNAIYLNAATDTSVQNPMPYLQQLTGGQDNVRVASDAGALAERIVELAIPRVQLISERTKAILSAPGFGDQEVRFESFAPDTSRPGVYVFKTIPFRLNKKVGSVTENVLKVEGQDGNGARHDSMFKLNIRN